RADSARMAAAAAIFFMCFPNWRDIVIFPRMRLSHGYRALRHAAPNKKPGIAAGLFFDLQGPAVTAAESRSRGAPDARPPTGSCRQAPARRALRAHRGWWSGWRHRP